MKILIATDGSVCSQKAIEEFCRMFEKAHNVDIKIASTFQAMNTLEAFGKDTEKSLALLESAKAAVADAKNFIAERIPQAKIEAIDSIDLPEMFINENASGWNPNLIVVGTEKREFWDRMMLGSFCHTSVNTAPFSTLLARQKLRNLN